MRAMGIIDIATVLITLAAVFGYVNHRFTRLPATIGVMVIALLMSLGLIALNSLSRIDLVEPASRMLSRIDFNQSVALALALQRGPERLILVAVTCSVVLFSILVQGLRIGAVIRRSAATATP